MTTTTETQQARAARAERLARRITYRSRPHGGGHFDAPTMLPIVCDALSAILPFCAFRAPLDDPGFAALLETLEVAYPAELDEEVAAHEKRVAEREKRVRDSQAEIAERYQSEQEQAAEQRALAARHFAGQ